MGRSGNSPGLACGQHEPMTYVLHYAPDNASLIVRLALEELELPYRTVLVDRSVKAQTTKEYRAINPAGLIPAMETPQDTLFETAAILLWLTEQHGAMAPSPQDPQRSQFLKWLFFASNTLHAQLRISFYPDQYAGADPAAQTALRRHLQTAHPGRVNLPGALRLLDDFYAQDPNQNRVQPWVLDCYVAAMLRWCGLYPKGNTQWFQLTDYPALLNLAKRIETRPSAERVAKAEGLGPKPFSEPMPANPPEGTAI